VAEDIGVLTKEIKLIRKDLSYIKIKIDSLIKEKEKKNIEEIKTNQDGWFLW
jgi:hypothetical protein